MPVLSAVKEVQRESRLVWISYFRLIFFRCWRRAVVSGQSRSIPSMLSRAVRHAPVRTSRIASRYATTQAHHQAETDEYPAEEGLLLSSRPLLAYSALGLTIICCTRFQELVVDIWCACRRRNWPVLQVQETGPRGARGANAGVDEQVLTLPHAEQSERMEGQEQPAFEIVCRSGRNKVAVSERRAAARQAHEVPWVSRQQFEFRYRIADERILH